MSTFHFPTILTPNDVKNQLKIRHQQDLAVFKQADIYPLIHSRTQFFDALLQALWKQFQLHQYPTLALIAVGGYGRKEMFPHSDLDILFLNQQEYQEAILQKITLLLQFLWDANLEVGQSVRTVKQCLTLGQQDISIITNLLEGRFLLGNKTTWQQLQDQLHQPNMWSKQPFFQAKIDEKTKRYARYHNTAYNLEPDIKYSPGGLRDLQLLFWITLHPFSTRNLEDMLKFGLIYPSEYEVLHQCQTFLFRIRYALHLVIKRADNRLLFDRQLKISQLLGYTGEENQGVELMMKDYFRSCRQSLQLSQMLLLHYKEHVLHTPLSHQPDYLKNHVYDLDTNFMLCDNSILLKHPQCFEQTPHTLLQLFYHLTCYPFASIHSATLRQLHLTLRKIDTPLDDIPKAREIFLRILQQPHCIQRAIWPMHQQGILSAYTKTWKNIEGLMQFDLFHAYTVDEHSVRVMLKLESFNSHKEATQHPLCTQVFPTLPNKPLLFIAALFHDIAKGRGGDHAELGAIDVYEFAKKHQFNDDDATTMAWLVHHHLLLSVTAQRRDIYDPQVVYHFAQKIQHQRRLDYLLCLTVADICATHDTLWNNWKRSLINTLYQYTRQQLKQGMEHLLDQQEDAWKNQLKTLDLLKARSNLDLQNIQTFWQDLPQDYFLRNTPMQLAWHARLIINHDTKQPLVAISNDFDHGGSELFIYCQDKFGLFNQLMHLLENKNISVHDAQIITSKTGFALDTFVITEHYGEPLNAFRCHDIIQILQSNRPIKSYSHKHKRKPTQLLSFSVPTEIRFLNPKQLSFTELEIFTLDKPGLLAIISDVFTQLNLNLIHAKITTVGERAEDFFILTNSKAKALTKEQQIQLKNKIYQQLNP